MISVITQDWFSGGRNIAEDPDAKKELADLIIEIQTAINGLLVGPVAHAASHVTGGADVIANAVAGGAAGLMSGADKTKLDGIEAGADVTDATNVAAAGALMDPMTAQGDLIQEGAAGPEALPAGVAGQVLTSGGPAANNAWGDAGAAAFTAGAPASWVLPAPTTIQAAIDRIAAQLAAVGLAPIP